jgi:hypothetical protein
VIPESHVIWPFRVAFYIFPLKWGIPAIQYLDSIDATYNGAYLCDDVTRTDCLFHYKNNVPILPGWTCSTTPNGVYNKLGCYGYNGKQVLESLSISFGAISSKNQLGTQFGIVIAIGFVFQILAAIVSIQKASRYSTIVDTTAPKSKFYLSFKNSSTSTISETTEDKIEIGMINN